MSSSLTPCGAWSCLIVTLCALTAVEVSAARHHLRGTNADAHSVATGSTGRFTRRLSFTCATGCSNVMGTATNFAALAYTTITNNGPTFIFGPVGVFPGSSITGFNQSGGGQATGSIRRADSVTDKAQSDAHIGYAYLQSLTYTTDLSGSDLGGMTLYPGIYHFSGSAYLSANLTLDAQGNASAVFIFQTVSTFMTASASNVFLVNGTQACNVYYKVGSSTTLGANSTLAGNMVAYTSISLRNGSHVDGSLIACNAAVTLVVNQVDTSGECGSYPVAPPFPAAVPATPAVPNVPNGAASPPASPFSRNAPPPPASPSS